MTSFNFQQLQGRSFRSGRKCSTMVKKKEKLQDLCESWYVWSSWRSVGRSSHRTCKCSGALAVIPGRWLARRGAWACTSWARARARRELVGVVGGVLAGGGLLPPGLGGAEKRAGEAVDLWAPWALGGVGGACGSGRGRGGGVGCCWWWWWGPVGAGRRWEGLTWEGGRSRTGEGSWTL